MQPANKLFHGTRILIAEDEPISRQILESTLRSWGFLVEAYPDGTTAMAALEKGNSPQIAILDWEMPGLDGTEICSRLREAKRTTYAIMLTGKDGKQNLIEALNSGADDYLIKPSDPDELQARLRLGTRLIRLQLEMEALQAELHSIRSAHTNSLKGAG